MMFQRWLHGFSSGLLACQLPHAEEKGTAFEAFYSEKLEVGSSYPTDSIVVQIYPKPIL